MPIRTFKWKYLQDLKNLIKVLTSPAICYYYQRAPGMKFFLPPLNYHLRRPHHYLLIKMAKAGSLRVHLFAIKFLSTRVVKITRFPQPCWTHAKVQYSIQQYNNTVIPGVVILKCADITGTNKHTIIQ